MKTLLKWLLCILLILATLLIIATIALNLYLSPEKLKTLITKAVNQHSSFTMQIKGDLQWQVFPSFSINVSDIALTDTKDTIHLNNIAFGAELLPLLSGKLVAHDFAIKQMTLNDTTGHHINIEKATFNAATIKLNQPFPLDIRLASTINHNPLNLHLTATTTIAKDYNDITLNNYRLDINHHALTGDFHISGFNPPTHTQTLLQSLIVNGTINSKNLSFSKLTLSNLHAKLTGKNAILNIQPIFATVFEGQVNGQLQANLQKATPRYTMAAHAKGLNTEKLADALTQKTWLTGTFYANAHLSSSGKNMAELTQQLNGEIAATTDKGYVKTDQINPMLTTMLHLLNPSRKSQSLNYQTVKTNLKIVNGMGQLTGKLVSDDVLTTTKGQIDLVKQTLNIDVSANYLNSDRTKDVAIPIYIRGTFATPKISVDSSNILQQVAKQNTHELVNSVTQKLGKIDVSGLFGKQ